MSGKSGAEILFGHVAYGEAAVKNGSVLKGGVEGQMRSFCRLRELFGQKRLYIFAGSADYPIAFA